MADKVVIHYRDGRLVKGYATGFTGAELFIRVQDRDDPSKQTDVDLVSLKAVFFVRDFVGDASYDEVKEFQPDAALPGPHMEVALFDGEVLVGAVEGYRPERTGFFLDPVDPKSNNARCFIIAAAVHRASVI
jgi:Family of unknown function (DUF6982)